MEASIFRARARWYDEGEKNTKYFFRLEKQKYNNKTMYVLIREDGSISKNQKEILKMHSEFCKKLYTADLDIQFTFVNKYGIKLTNGEGDELDRPLTLEELSMAVKGMQKSKTPGCDGLPMEILVRLWHKIGELLLNVFNFTFEKGLLHLSARRGIISLIPKKGRDEKYFKNWRPIALLNTDYKILTKALAQRVKPYLSKLIHESQTGFVAGRHVLNNIRKILDLIDYAHQEQIDAILISLDFKKAFDRVERESLIDMLEYFNFGPIFCKWTRIIYI